MANLDLEMFGSEETLGRLIIFPSQASIPPQWDQSWETDTDGKMFICLLSQLKSLSIAENFQSLGTSCSVLALLLYALVSLKLKKKQNQKKAQGQGSLAGSEKASLIWTQCPRFYH